MRDEPRAPHISHRARRRTGDDERCAAPVGSSLIAWRVRRCCARRRGGRRCRRRAPGSWQATRRPGHSLGVSCWYSNTRSPARGWRYRRSRVWNWATSSCGHHSANSGLAATRRSTRSTNSRVVADRRCAGSELGHDPSRLIRPVDEQPAGVRLGEHHPQQIALVVGEAIDQWIQQRLRSVPCEEVPPRAQHVRRCGFHRRDQSHQRVGSVLDGLDRLQRRASGQAPAGVAARRRRGATHAPVQPARRPRR